MSDCGNVFDFVYDHMCDYVPDCDTVCNFVFDHM